MVEIIGWIGALLLGLCAVPQAVRTFLVGRADDISWGFLGMWLVGEFFLIAYNHLTLNSLALSANYYLNVACLLVIVYYKRWPISRLETGEEMLKYE